MLRRMTKIESLPQRLKKLRERSGLTMKLVAKGLNYRGSSSYQRYEDDDLFKKSELPLPIARGLATLFVGRGDPPITEAEVLSLAGLDNLSSSQMLALDDQQIVWCVGEVAAGVWRDAFEWPRDEWIPFPLILLDSRYPAIERRALRVRGDSMDELYPDGSYVMYVRLADIGRKPQTGDRVVVLRHRHGQTEATVKEYRRDGAKRRWLLPRSSNPSYTAIEIDGKRDEEIEVMGLVVGSQRVE